MPMMAGSSADRFAGRPGVTEDSALLIPVPEAAPLVREHRLRLDPNAAAGVPEHITLLSPFIRPDRLDAGVRWRLAALFARVRSLPFPLTSGPWVREPVMLLPPGAPTPVLPP